MVEIEWKPLPTPMWPEGSVMADCSGLLLEASFEQGVPTWKVQRSMGKNALPTLVATHSTTIRLNAPRHMPLDRAKGGGFMPSMIEGNGRHFSVELGNMLTSPER